MTIGKPLENYTAYIINTETLELVPHGMLGELVIGGNGVSKGYLNRDDLTNEKFFVNPFGTSTASNFNNLLYKTGDLCRFTEHGNIEYFGRIDCQVKLRGFRIEV
jgi:non-ribosomal peptide synthetase component F